MSPSGTGHPPLISQHKATRRPRQWQCESHSLHPPPQLQIKHLMSTWINRVCVKILSGIRVESYLKLQDIRWIPRSNAWFWLTWSVSTWFIYCEQHFWGSWKIPHATELKWKCSLTRNRVWWCNSSCHCLQWHLGSTTIRDELDQRSVRGFVIAIVLFLAW